MVLRKGSDAATTPRPAGPPARPPPGPMAHRSHHRLVLHSRGMRCGRGARWLGAGVRASGDLYPSASRRKKKKKTPAPDQRRERSGGGVCPARAAPRAAPARPPPPNAPPPMLRPISLLPPRTGGIKAEGAARGRGAQQGSEREDGRREAGHGFFFAFVVLCLTAEIRGGPDQRTGTLKIAGCVILPDRWSGRAGAGEVGRPGGKIAEGGERGQGVRKSEIGRAHV